MKIYTLTLLIFSVFLVCNVFGNIEDLYNTCYNLINNGQLEKANHFLSSTINSTSKTVDIFLKLSNDNKLNLYSDVSYLRLATSHYMLGLLKSIEGSYEESEKHLEEGCTGLMNSQGLIHSKTMDCYNNYLKVLKMEGKEKEWIKLKAKLDYIESSEEEMNENHSCLNQIINITTQFKQALTTEEKQKYITELNRLKQLSNNDQNINIFKYTIELLRIYSLNSNMINSEYRRTSLTYWKNIENENRWKLHEFSRKLIIIESLREYCNSSYEDMIEDHVVFDFFESDEYYIFIKFLICIPVEIIVAVYIKSIMNWLKIKFCGNSTLMTPIKAHTFTTTISNVYKPTEHEIEVKKKKEKAFTCEVASFKRKIENEEEEGEVEIEEKDNSEDIKRKQFIEKIKEDVKKEKQEQNEKSKKVRNRKKNREKKNGIVKQNKNDNKMNNDVKEKEEEQILEEKQIIQEEEQSVEKPKQSDNNENQEVEITKQKNDEKKSHTINEENDYSNEIEKEENKHNLDESNDNDDEIDEITEQPKIESTNSNVSLSVILSSTTDLIVEENKNANVINDDISSPQIKSSNITNNYPFNHNHNNNNIYNSPNNRNNYNNNNNNNNRRNYRRKNYNNNNNKQSYKQQQNRYNKDNNQYNMSNTSPISYNGIYPPPHLLSPPPPPSIIPLSSSLMSNYYPSPVKKSNNEMMDNYIHLVNITFYVYFKPSSNEHCEIFFPFIHDPTQNNDNNNHYEFTQRISDSNIYELTLKIPFYNEIEPLVYRYALSVGKDLKNYGVVHKLLIKESDKDLWLETEFIQYEIVRYRRMKQSFKQQFMIDSYYPVNNNNEHIEDIYVNPEYSKSEILSLLIYQIEYYFSEENLDADDYLKSKMDDEGFVDLSLLLTFTNVIRFTNDIAILCQSVIMSKQLELKIDDIYELKSSKIRNKDNYKKFIK